MKKIGSGRAAALLTLLAGSLAAHPVVAQAHIGANFTGNTLTDIENLTGTLFAPPDTDGAVGPDHYVQFINGAYSVYNKTGSLVGAKISDTQFWQNAGISSTVTDPGLSDTRILYDAQSQHWFAVEITLADTGNKVLIARSNTSDPTQGFKAVAVQADHHTARGQFGDFPTLGINAESVQIGLNSFSGNSFTGYDLLTIPKADLLGNTPSASRLTSFTGSNSSPLFSLTSATDYGPGTGHATVVSAEASDSNSLYVFNVSKLTSGANQATTSATNTIGVQSYSTPPNADQKGTSVQISTNDSALSSTVYKVGDKIYLVHSTTADGHAAIRWTILSESTQQVLQEGTISSPNFDYYFPSISANQDGQAVIGFTRSGLTDYASAYAVTGTTTGSGLAFGTPFLLKQGTASYSLLGDPERWGDFSATTLDPLNSHSFWTTQEFATTDADGNPIWATQITQISLAAVPEISTVVSFASVFVLGGAALARKSRKRAR